MSGYSAADWIFCGFILLVIFVCVAISDMRRLKGSSEKLPVQGG
jgi:hypothetical protein